MAESKETLFNEESIEALRKTYSAVKALREERKSISEDISEEKKDCAKKTGMQVKDLNAVFKILESRENGTYSEDYVKIARAIEIGVGSGTKTKKDE
jgi:uncharacterized protein YaaN involved in tellurite resistance